MDNFLEMQSSNLSPSIYTFSATKLIGGKFVKVDNFQIKDQHHNIKSKTDINKKINDILLNIWYIVEYINNNESNIFFTSKQPQMQYPGVYSTNIPNYVLSATQAGQ